MVAISIGESEFKHTLFFEALQPAGEDHELKIFSPLICRDGGEGNGIWIGQHRKISFENGLIKNADSVFLQSIADFKNYGVLK